MTILIATSPGRPGFGPQLALSYDSGAGNGPFELDGRPGPGGRTPAPLRMQDADPTSLEDLPIGLDGGQYRSVELDGEGLSGILTEQGQAWYYKPNLGDGRFGPLTTVARKPSLAALNADLQLPDLVGDGQFDLALFSASIPGFFERRADVDWTAFRPFQSLSNLRWDDPNLRFVDLTGDGHADVLVTEDQVSPWYLSLAEAGFAEAQHVPSPGTSSRDHAWSLPTAASRSI